MAQKTEPTKAKTALIEAFRRLLLQRPYDKIYVPNIVAEADVSRSTFYEHFRNKNEIMRACLGGVLDVLAKAGSADVDLAEIVSTLDHFQEVGSLSKICLNTPVSAIVVQVLGEAIEGRLEARLGDSAPILPVPLELISVQVAESSLGLVRAWLNDPDPADSQLIADQLDASASALLGLVAE